MEIIGIVVLLFLVYSGVVLLVEVVESISMKEAIVEVNKHVQQLALGIVNLFQKEEVKPQYNIYLGFDECGYPISSSIDGIFGDINRIYQNYYFYDCRMGENRLIYRLRVSQPVLSMSDEQLFEYCNSVCDSLIHKELHKLYPDFLHMDNLVAVSVHQDYIDVFIAENVDGQHENAILKEKIRRRFKTSNLRNDTSIEEDWNA